MSTALQFLKRNQHQIWFFLLSVILFAVSLAIAFLGVLYGAHVLQALNADGKIELATMGELLGGTLGVAVAFAGAWVAFKIASFANQTLELQELREASRTANETMEKSIGKILEVQLHFEALLHQIAELGPHLEERGKLHAQCYSCESKIAEIQQSAKNQTNGGDVQSRLLQRASEKVLEKAAQEDLKRAQEALELNERKVVKPACELVKTAADALAHSVRTILTNPLAISVLFALQESKPDDRHPSRQKLLEDLAQLPRKLDLLRAKADDIDRHFPFLLSPGVMLIQMYNSLGSETNHDETLLKLHFQLKRFPMHYRHVVSGLELLDSLIYEKDLWSTDGEQFLVLCMRYFVYSEKEARDAIDKVLTDTFLRNEDSRRIILNSRSAQAFYSSGMTNDEQAAEFLDGSNIIHQEVKALALDSTCGAEESARSRALRCLAIKAAFEVSEKGYQESEELLRESAGLSVYQIYFFVYGSGPGSAGWSKRAIRFMRKTRSVFLLRDKLQKFAKGFSQSSYLWTVQRLANEAEFGNSLSELDSLELSADYFKKVPRERAALFDASIRMLNQRVAEAVLCDRSSDEQKTIVEYLSETRAMPRIVKMVCLAYRKFKNKDGRDEKTEMFLFKCFKMLETPDNRTLCVDAEYNGLQAEVESDDVILECPATNFKACGRLIQHEQNGVVLEIEFRSPSNASAVDLHKIIEQATFQQCVEKLRGEMRDDESLAEALAEARRNWKVLTRPDGSCWFQLNKVYAAAEIHDDLLMVQEIHKRAKPFSAGGDQKDNDVTNI